MFRIIYLETRNYSTPSIVTQVNPFLTPKTKLFKQPKTFGRSKLPKSPAPFRFFNHFYCTVILIKPCAFLCPLSIEVLVKE